MSCALQVTVAPQYRRLGLAKRCMDELERVSDAMYRGHFVDLFVRTSNKLAIQMYSKFGYSVYRYDAYAVVTAVPLAI